MTPKVTIVPLTEEQFQKLPFPDTARAIGGLLVLEEDPLGNSSNVEAFRKHWNDMIANSSLIKPDFDSKDIFLQKGDEIVGLHGIGHKEETPIIVTDIDGSQFARTLDFMYLEKWGNSYDKNFKMLGGSFRIFDLCLEDLAANMEAEGWVRIEGPKGKGEQV